MNKIFRMNDINDVFEIWGHSSAGRAPAWHAGGLRFKSAWLHLIFKFIKKYNDLHKNND